MITLQVNFSLALGPFNIRYFNIWHLKHDIDNHLIGTLHTNYTQYKQCLPFLLSLNFLTHLEQN